MRNGTAAYNRLGVTRWASHACLGYFWVSQMIRLEFAANGTDDYTRLGVTRTP